MRGYRDRVGFSPGGVIDPMNPVSIPIFECFQVIGLGWRCSWSSAKFCRNRWCQNPVHRFQRFGEVGLTGMIRVRRFLGFRHDLKRGWQ